MNGICVITSGKVTGEVHMKDTKRGLYLDIKLQNIKEGKHGFHVHEFGDMRNPCGSLGGHYNPDNEEHGGLNVKHRHKGDFGNVDADKNNEVNKRMYVRDTTVMELLGRSLVIHEKEDDLGMGGNEESKKTGNAGKRIGCGVIGIKNKKLN